MGRGVEPVKVIVCGGRDYADQERVNRVLDGINIAAIAHGGAKGADALAGLYAARKGIPVQEYAADWSQGRAAGPRRNERMLRESKPDLVIAFPGGKGTAHMVSIARKAAVPVVEIGAGFCSPGCREFNEYGREA